MRSPKLLISLLLAILMLSAAGVLYGFQAEKAAKPKSSAAKTSETHSAKTAAAPAKTLRGIDEDAMDKSADPCEDFFQYACGGWVKSHPVPADRPSYSRFGELLDKNQDVLHDILEKAKEGTGDPLHKKIGDYYATCMDEDAINRKGVSPVKPELDRIDALTSKNQLAEYVGHVYPLGVRVFFGFFANQDAKDATQVIAQASQGGLGLPDRDYYTNTDKKSVETRDAYVKHVENMLKLAGDQQAADDAQKAMKIETALANASLKRVQLRDPKNTYHKMQKSELAALSPAFGWDKFLAGIQAPPIASLNVAEPDFFKGFQQVIEQNDLDSIKAYLRWHVLRAAAPVLSNDFVSEDFAFNGKVLRGTLELEPRWKRCVRSTDRALGEMLGQPYVKQNFPPSAKERTLRMVQEIEGMMEVDIKALPWMSDTTKAKALEKLHAVANKIGYPDHWRDYSALTVTRGDNFGNAMRSDTFEFHRNMNKIGKPVDKTEWGMTPPTVNAYYSPLQNNINFPAGILQPPFYDPGREEAINYGGVGAVVGHELTHGFDDQGRKFDPQGNLRDWWTEQDGSAFEERATCEANEYSSFVATDDVHVNGRLTLGENTADNGGLRLAYMAMQKAAKKKGKNAQGYTPEQLLFLGWGQVWCENQRPEALRLQVATNPHSPGKFRIIGVVQNMPEFAQAFGCHKGQKMVSENACRVW